MRVSSRRLILYSLNYKQNFDRCPQLKKEHETREQGWSKLQFATIVKVLDEMSMNPFNKRQKVPEIETPAEVTNDSTGVNKSKQSYSPLPLESPPATSTNSLTKSRTPKKLASAHSDSSSGQSQPFNTSSSLQAPSLQPPDTSSRGRENRTYSQSPPRSPGRSPTRKLELIQLSPVKKNRLELQKIYDTQQSQGRIGRLCIDKLVLNDFKSYAGRQIVGPFHSSFSAVVGPNGSGKSNVIDSMLFVFGFRASKMRQDRLSDLIHNSEVHPNLPSCSVEVHFHYVIDEENGQTTINTEKPRLIITRKAFRNNSSKYFINDKESNYTEVTKLLKAEGIDLDHKRFLILQGEVENIAQMRPKAEKEGDDGLLEYLEDIIGTAKYKPLIESNIKEIEALNEICIEKENRFQLVDKEKQSLESGKESALEFLSKERKLTLLKSKLLQYNIWQGNTKLCRTLEKSSKLKGEMEAEIEKYSSTMKEMDTIKSENNAITDKIQEYEIEMKDLLTKKRALDGERSSNDEKQKNIRKKKKKAEELLNSTNRTLTQSNAKLVELREAQVGYEKELKDLNNELNIERPKLEDIKLSLKDLTVDISSQISIYEKELEPWNEKLQEKKAEIQLVESEILLMQESQMKLKNEINSLTEEMEGKAQEQELREERIKKLDQEKKVIVRDISVGISECSSARERLKEMQDVLSSHRQRAIDARAALSTAENKSNVLTALSKLQKSGRIHGFHGRLGDLGVIDEKYDIAISTACGRLEDIVVDSVDCGQQCIEYLRKNNLGYARFILLDKLRNFNTNPIHTPENVSRLFDLVQPRADKFIPAFYSVLRDTLVSSELSQANRVAYGKKRFRVVTLDGKLIDLSGTISGGGNHVARGLMKLKQTQTEYSEIYTPEEVAELEKAVAERENNFKVASDTLHEMEQELKSLQAREPEIELTISQLIMDIDSWKNESKLKEAQLAEKQQTYETSIRGNEDYDQAELRLKSLKGERESLQGQTKNIMTSIQALKEEIMKIGGSELQIQNSKVNSILQRIEISNAKQKKEKASIRKTETEIKKYEKSLLVLSKDLDSYTEEDQRIELNQEQVDHRRNEIETSLNKIQDLKADLNDKMESLPKRLSELEENAARFKSLKIEIEDKLEKLNSLVNHLKKELKKYEAEIDNLKIRDVANTLKLLDEQEAKGKEENPSNNCQNEENEVTEGEIQVSDNDVPMAIDQQDATLENGLPRISEADLKELDLANLEGEILKLQDYVDNANADVEVLEEYAKRLAEYRARRLDLNKAVEQRDEMRRKLDELKKKRFDEFMQGFGIISMTLKEMYQMITMGGNAELELVDSLDPFSEGVTFSVMPPKKSWRNITNLSGGEKTLSSLALVFALHKYKPTPLYVMDEIDAALDFRNVSIVANYIKERTKNAQFIVISLRNNMFELAQQLVGIYKRENMTRSATLQNREFIKSIP